MKTAFTVWGGRIAPVFDTAREVCLVETAGTRIVSEETYALPAGAINWLSEKRVEVLVCGAVSRPVHAQLRAANIRVIPFVAGTLGKVMRAWVSGDFRGSSFAMPGCCGHHRRSCHAGRRRCGLPS